METLSEADSGGCNQVLEEKEEGVFLPERHVEISEDRCTGRRRRGGPEFDYLNWEPTADGHSMRPFKQKRFQSLVGEQEVQEFGPDEEQKLERILTSVQEEVAMALWRPDGDFAIRVPLGTDEISQGDGDQRSSSELFERESEGHAGFPSAAVQEITSAVAVSNVQNGGSSGDEDSQTSSSGSGSTSTGGSSSNSSMSSDDDDSSSSGSGSGSGNHEMERDSPATSNSDAKHVELNLAEGSSSEHVIMSRGVGSDSMDTDHQEQAHQVSQQQDPPPQEHRNQESTSLRNQPDLSSTMPAAPRRNLEDGPCPPHGMVSICGRRREMEDAVCSSPTFLSLPSPPSTYSFNGPGRNSFHFFGVYDGHGGAQAAEYCAERLHHILAEEMMSLIESTDPNVVAADNCNGLWKAAVARCFMKMDAQVAGVCWRGDQCGVPEGTPRCCAEPVAPDTVGSTAVIAAVSSRQIIIGNCGDSRAVLSRKGKSVALTQDHKPDRDDELARIENAGGRVIFWNGHRVMGVLAMSRAIGDQYLKPYVIADPDVTCYERTEEDECLVLASDGLWDVLSNDLVCQIALKNLKRPRARRGNMLTQQNLSPSGDEDSPAAAAAAYLTELALGRGSSDNISVVVVDLRAAPEGSSSRST